MNLPRGIRTFDSPETEGRTAPHACEWRVEGKRKTKFFPTKGERDAFAKTLAGDMRQHGVGAFMLNPNEATEWRAFRYAVGEEVPLDRVLAVWEQYGRKTSGISVSLAVTRFMEAKTAEGLARDTHRHYVAIYARFNETFGKTGVNRVKREDVRAWLAANAGPLQTQRTVFNRIRGLFNWLVNTEQLDKSPCAGIAGPKIPMAPVHVLTVDETKRLFAAAQPMPELAGRLALEAFAGLRYSSAAKIVPADVDFAEKGLIIPAHSIKTQRREYIDRLPENLWKWLETASVSQWRMTQRQYLQAKSKLFVDAEVPHPRNCLRHSFATYHVAAYRNAAETSVILCHTKPTMLYKHYKGNASHTDGLAYFQIVPKCV